MKQAENPSGGPRAEPLAQECSWQEPATLATLSGPKALIADSIIEIAKASEPDLPLL